MRAKAIVAVVALVTGVLFGTAPPAGAVGAGVSASADISVSSGGVCATVTFPTPTVFAGEFSVVGVAQGPGSKVATVRGVIPFAQVDPTSDSWSECLPGPPNATAGAVTYTLVVSAANGGEVVHVVVCTIENGHVSCA